jgi:ATP dependent DNA ligase domain
MLLRSASYGFIQPALPSSAECRRPALAGFTRLSNDGYRLMVRRDGAGVRLLIRDGYDWSDRFPTILEAANRLTVRTCLIDGEAVCCDDNGIAVFERLRHKHEPADVFLYAFDLLELDGEEGDARQRVAGKPGRPSPKRALRAFGRRGVPTRLQDGARRHRLETARLALRVRPHSFVGSNSKTRRRRR